MAKVKAKKYKRYAAPAGKAKVLIFDIETAPILAHVWGLWENNVGLNQIAKDWHVMSWSAKWHGAPETEVMYMDQRNASRIEDDRALLKEIWSLLDEADVVITQNGKRFDQRKLNAKFVQHKINHAPPSSFKHIDTKLVAQKHFDFPSYRLEYMTNLLCTRYKKLKHKKFPGHELWTACLAGNVDAWNEMEEYNKHDVLALEELYFDHFAAWDGNTTVNFDLFTDSGISTCKCGGTDFAKNGFYYTSVGQYQRLKCKAKDCGAEYRSRKNLMSKEKKDSLLIGTAR